MTAGHTLIVPHRHVASWFDLYPPETAAIERLLHEQRRDLQEGDASIEGFNVGINAREAAGQTIFHCHVHSFPGGGTMSTTPRGGVRHVIPGRGSY